MNTTVAKTRLYSKFLGALLLISGTTIGGGMLALPITTAPHGFLPASLLLAMTWMVMLFTSFLILEATLASGKHANIVSISQKTLGKFGRIFSWICYLLLLYSLISTYVSAIGSLLESTLSQYVGHNAAFAFVVCLVVFITAILVMYGIGIIDKINRVLILGGIVCFIILLTKLTPHSSLAHLSNINLSYILSPLPVLVTSFGFHIVIPSLVNYLNRDIKLIRLCLLMGSIIPLLVYLSWQLAITGSLPLKGENGIFSILNSTDQLGMLNKALEFVTKSTLVYSITSLFSIFAILTSLLGVAISLWDFLVDGLAYYNLKNNKALISSCVFIPPIWLVIFYPKAFTTLLGYAGIFVSLLLGILPISICWIGRKNKNWGFEYKAKGGKTVMIFSLVFFLAVIFTQLFQKL